MNNNKHINKNVPIKPEWCDRARGCYCPTCITGVSMSATECRYCGQKLIPYLQ